MKTMWRYLTGQSTESAQNERDTRDLYATLHEIDRKLTRLEAKYGVGRTTP